MCNKHFHVFLLQQFNPDPQSPPDPRLSHEIRNFPTDLRTALWDERHIPWNVTAPRRDKLFWTHYASQFIVRSGHKQVHEKTLREVGRVPTALPQTFPWFCLAPTSSHELVRTWKEIVAPYQTNSVAFSRQAKYTD
jgi:hypothetical protein